MGDDGQVRVVASERLRAERAQALAGVIGRLRGSADSGLSTDDIMAMTRE